MNNLYFKYYEEATSSRFKEESEYSKYIVNKTAFISVFTKYLKDDYLKYDVHTSPTLDVPLSFLDYKTIMFDNVEELFEDFVNGFKKHFENLPLQIFVILTNINKRPVILFSINDTDYSFYYSFENDSVNNIKATKIPKFITEGAVYLKRYETVAEAFKDPSIINYIDVLNEI